MEAESWRYRWWRLQAVWAKGARHWFNLARSYGSQFAQHAFGQWRPESLSWAECLAALNLPSDLHRVAEHFRHRTTPHFACSADEAAERVAGVDAACRAATVFAAEAVCRRTFQFRGEPPITFTEAINWQHRPHENTDWMWELNRHAYFVTLGRAFAYTGDARYVAAFVELVRDWMQHNAPAIAAPNWASPLEVAFRLNVWTWAYYHFRAALDDAALSEVVRGLWWHARFLAANLEYTSPNNHLLLQAKALAQAGVLFPEFKAAGRWKQLGLEVLWAEVRRQVHADGVHAEQSMLYHQIITSELLEALVLLQSNSVEVPREVLERYDRMLNAERALLKPNGEPPLLGDSALGDSYVRFHALNGAAVWRQRPELAVGEMDEATQWLVGRTEPPRPGAEPGSQAFTDGGYFIMRAAGTHLVFDCGPFSYPPAPGHGQADALNFELYAQGQTLIVDPGVYSYHLGTAWRQFFRGTRAHNTLSINGLDQSVMLDNWRVLRPARARLYQWLSRPGFDFVDGAHDGYQRLPGAITHRRQIFFFKPHYFIVLDQVTGSGAPRCDVYFHLPAEAETELEAATGLVRIRAQGGRGLLICPAWPFTTEIVSGQEQPIQGWVSRYSGVKQAAPAVIYSQTRPLPALFITVLYPTPNPAEANVSVTALDLGLDIQALRLRIESDTDYFVLDQRPQSVLKVFDDFASDAALTHLRVDSAGHVTSRILHGGRTLRRNGVAIGEAPATARVD
jgi:hypothetical protein